MLIAHAIFLAHVKGNGVRVTSTQLPDLYARCEAASRRLGLAAVPEVYVLQSGGVLNAFATKLLSRKFVIIYSSLIDQCMDPRELDFVIGHEIGHFAAGHLTWNGFLAPFHLLPWLGPAYSRAREYTCDRCGLDVVEDFEPSARALCVLAAGGKMASQVDLNVFAQQRAESGSFWMATLELNLSHPYLCKRVAALQEFRQPGSAPVVPRNVLAYPLAPLFGVFAGGAAGGAAGVVMVMVAIVGMMAAVAIPAIKEYQRNVRQAGMAGAYHPGGAGLGDANSADDSDEAAQEKQLLKALQNLQQQQADGASDEPAPPTTPTPDKRKHR